MTAERARDLAPLVPDTHIACGFVEAAAGNRKAALDSYRKALEIDPDNTVAHNEIARLHLRSGTAGSLAKATMGFATAVQTDPRAGVSRHNLDVAVGTFLARAAGLLLVAAIIARGFGNSGTVASRIAPLALLLVPGLFVTRFVLRLTRELRRYLWRTVIHPKTRLIAVTAEALAVVVIIVGAVAPEGIRLHLLDVALGFAVVSLFSPSGAQDLRRKGRSGSGAGPQHDIPAGPTIGKGVLWLIAASLAGVCVLGAVVASNPSTAPGGIIVSLGCAAGCGYTLRTIRSRSRPRSAGSDQTRL